MDADRLREETVIRGSSFTPEYQIRDGAGDLIDLTQGGVEVRYRTQLRGGDMTEKTKGGGVGEMTVTADGRFSPKFSVDETKDLWPNHGRVDVEVVVEVSGSRVYQATGLLLVKNPKTGVL